MVRTANIKFTVIGFSALFLLIVAILLDLQYLYLMAAALAVLPLASYLLAYVLSARFSAEREHPATAQEGRILPVTLTVTAEGGLPQASLRIADTLPPELSPVDIEANAVTLDMWDGKTGTRSYKLEPTKRGVYRIGPVRIVTTDPLGLFLFGAALDASTELVVHPTPVPTRDSPVGGEGIYGVRERDGKTRRGDGMDFHGVREYREGDALRRVHWPTTARTGRLAVVEFERAFQRDIVIGLDLTRGTEHGKGRETTLEYAVKAAATLATRTLAAGGGVTLVTQMGTAVIRFGDSDPAAGRFRLFDLLARVQAVHDRSLAESLQAARPGEGSHFVILTSWGDPRLTAYLTNRVHHGETVRVFFFEPASFGGPRMSSPAVAGGELRVIQREHSPWEAGGNGLEHHLRDIRP